MARPTRRLLTVLSPGPLSIAAHMVAAMVYILGTAFGDCIRSATLSTTTSQSNIRGSRAYMPTTSVAVRGFRFGRWAGRGKQHLDHLAERAVFDKTGNAGKLRPVRARTLATGDATSAFAFLPAVNARAAGRSTSRWRQTPAPGVRAQAQQIDCGTRTSEQRQVGSSRQQAHMCDMASGAERLPGRWRGSRRQ
jgi:hypothetical protein